VVNGAIGRFLGKVVWIGLTLTALWFSGVGASFLVMATGWLVDLLIGHGPDAPDQAAAVLSLALLALGMSLGAFATISLPGLWFVAYTVRVFRRGDRLARRYD
jgi:hypothetical protein